VCVYVCVCVDPFVCGRQDDRPMSRRTLSLSLCLLLCVCEGTAVVCWSAFSLCVDCCALCGIVCVRVYMSCLWRPHTLYQLCGDIKDVLP